MANGFLDTTEAAKAMTTQTKGADCGASESGGDVVSGLDEGAAVRVGDAVDECDPLDPARLAYQQMQRDHEAMNVLRRMADEVSATGWHYEDGVLERCSIGGDPDPASAVLFSMDYAMGQHIPQPFDEETNDAIRRIPGLLIALAQNLDRIREAAAHHGSESRTP